ncbi:MAG: NAD-dependent epimerase/dehydratase family protein [Elusimicrobia bacterium]|nr:NAD-dependent epimerase/dehydratase family protein [Elusimicrobiota bacterium]
MTSAAGSALVTGAGGLIGRRLASILVNAERLDARNLPAGGGKARALFHMAGLTSASACEENPAAAYEANVALFQRTLEHAVRRGVSTIVFPSSGLVYGEALLRPALESDLPRPGGYYAATKLAAEALLLGACRRWGLAGVAARLSNVYAEDMRPDTMFGAVFAQLRAGKEPRVRDLSPVRDFLHVGDAAEGLRRLAAVARPGEMLAVNLSTGRGFSVGQAVELARRAFGLPERLLPSQGKGPTLVLDNSLLFQLTGWRPPELSTKLLREICVDNFGPKPAGPK